MQSCPCLCNDSAFAEVDEARLGNCRVLADGFQNRFGNLSVHADQGNGFGAGSGIAAAESESGYVDPMLAEGRADMADHTRAVLIPEVKHSAIKLRFQRN